jgi:RNA polymerase sigma factor (sigma-70 family)
VNAPAECTGRPDDPARPAVVELFDANWKWMVQLATLITGHRAVAEDVVAELFSDLAARPRQMDNARGYLRTAVVNRCRNHHRRAWREQARVDDHERALLPTTEALELWDALRLLSGRKRAVVVLRYWEDLTTDEIADALGCRPGTVSSLLHRAVNDLRKELQR